ncbi:ATPase [Burkholderia sp. SG-MS1]|uniref:ATP-binding response regulator n=1 Tax=Paraburkholderia sp. SG-MS1 TaxID=2023741 RepID=UPI00144585EA|nr:ATP-binding protein [Paraburkholderia sp. SG-MS1]NKJ49355.1 ATPase [Paraburkholderia sp. SG-MS1]
MRHRILATPVSSNLSLVAVRDRSRQIGELFGLDNLQRTRFITAVSEIARNAVQFAGGGMLTFFVGDATDAGDTQCVVAQISDKGPGIAHLDVVLLESSHRHGATGVGIPGSQRMADGFFVQSAPGQGTTVTIEMFLPRGTPRLSLRALGELVDQLTQRKPQSPVEELEKQNREMLLALEELRRKRAELEEADIRKNEFLAMLAHELRNPLAAISLSLELAAHADESRSRETFAVIGRQTAQLSRMVEDLLDVSRLTRGKVELQTEVVRIDTLIDGGVEMAAAEIRRRGHSVRIAYPPEPLSVRVDVARLKQVFNNIVHNAARYTSQPDTIDITVTNAGSEVVVAIADRGIGIDPIMLPRVFDLFAQATGGIGRQDAGLGIGLTVVQRLVKDHGGSVQAYSDGVGKGARIVVTLPVAHEEIAFDDLDVVDEMPDATEAIELTEASVPQKILVVDDNRDSADALAALLDMHGHECRVAYDGSSALKLAETFAATIGIVDLGLPDMPGFDVARALLARAESAPCTLIALSGYSTATFRTDAAEAGFSHFFAKPVAIEELLGYLEKR